MKINLKLDEDFEYTFDHLCREHGKDFQILNGLHESQLNFSDFIDGFIDKNVADASIDGNANAHYKDICSLTNLKTNFLHSIKSFMSSRRSMVFVQPESGSNWNGLEPSIFMMLQVHLTSLTAMHTT